MNKLRETFKFMAKFGFYAKLYKKQVQYFCIHNVSFGYELVEPREWYGLFNAYKYRNYFASHTKKSKLHKSHKDRRNWKKTILELELE